jgi:repressor LexA
MGGDGQYLEVLRAYYGQHGVLPSYATIGQLVGLSSKASVAEMVGRLKQRHYLDSTPDRRLRPGPRFHEREVTGRVRAGQPDAGQETPAETLSLDSFVIGGRRNTVLVPVKGDSMNDAGIRDGDLAVVELREDARSGEIVVAMIHGELTIKRLAYERGRPVLRPESAAFDTIRPEGDLQIIGVLIGLVRRYR